MQTIKRYIFVACCLAMLSCSKSPADIAEGDQEQGSFSMQLKSDGSNGEPVFGTPYGSVAEEYAVEIYKNEKLYTSYPKMGDMLESSRLNVGDYTMKVYWGPNSPKSFEIPYYEGKSDFTIAKDVKTEIPITAVLANTKVSVAFTESMSTFYVYYKAEIATPYTVKDGQIDPLIFESTETRNAYFKSAKMSIIVTVIPQGAIKEKYYQLEPIDAAPREHYKIKIAPSSALIGLDVTLDETLNAKSETYTISESVLPDYVPRVNFVFSNDFQSGSALGSSVQLFADNNIKSVIFSVEKDGVEIVNHQLVGVSDTDRLTIENAGIEWKGDLSTMKSSAIWVTKYLNSLAAGNYNLNIDITDSKNLNTNISYDINVK